MRRLSRCLHTIRLELNNNVDGARFPSLASFCVVPKSIEENKEALIRSTKSITFNTSKYVGTQQVRKYVPTSSTLAEEVCWNCKGKGRKNHMLCLSCGFLQDVDMEINYFHLLNLPNQFSLEQQELTRRFRQLQTLVHPDKFSNRTSREQNNSADWSALINKAYKTLSAPIERGQYLLKLQGEQMPQDNSALNKEFLMEMMEINEEVVDAKSSEDLQRLNEGIVQQLNEAVKELSIKFESNVLSEAKSLLVKMKYLLSVQRSIKNKLQKMMGG
ncbi:iron-sulfur cluster co-chaperone protein HscB [Zeugodacus cucurbitae]|uniref:Iron-sulfur cluster co-chaperone protein HscB, mitochondrial n=1 Tax=Zeugodacus cucurbitae TaxID=28588 RepID=A0A0A1WQM7_ZEUCU|nr:iron-sulfur cluster co-chaperone protein HscB [Zeugodacus cucurbitae]